MKNENVKVKGEKYNAMLPAFMGRPIDGLSSMIEEIKVHVEKVYY